MKVFFFVNYSQEKQNQNSMCLFTCREGRERENSRTLLAGMTMRKNNPLSFEIIIINLENAIQLLISPF